MFRQWLFYCRLYWRWRAKRRGNQVLVQVAEDEMMVPTTTQYLMATGKQALVLLHSAASLIPVPLVKETIGLAVKIIEACEESSAVSKKVHELQERISHVMIVIVDHVTVKYECGEVFVDAVDGIEKDLKDLLSTLKMIDQQLAELRNQNQLLQGLYSDLNMDVVEICLKRLSAAQEKFKMANDLRDSNLLLGLHDRLHKIFRKIDDMDKSVKHVAEDLKYMTDEVENISTYLSKSRESARSDIVAQAQIPLKPGIFHGREGLVDEIARLLVKKEPAYVCLLGPGGMGKTSVLLAVVDLPLIKEHFPGANRVWASCIEATSAALLLEILYIQLQVPGNQQVTLEGIISELNASKRPRLILLDNFETPWNATGAQKQIEDILRQLAELSHIAIFVTMRGAHPPCDDVIRWQSKIIEPTDEEACCRIYHDNNPHSKDSTDDVGRLLAVLGYMPFAITLMAKLGKEGKSTAKELLDAWRESGPDIFSDKPEESMNRSISLSVESDLVKQNPNAGTLLAILSLLPAGTTKQNLRWWALDSPLKPSMIPAAIATLSKAGLLTENNGQTSDTPVLFVVPVVQSFMQQRGRIEEKIRKQIQVSCCQYVLDHARRYTDPTFPDQSERLAAEDTNIQSILFGSPHTIPSDRSVEALISFSWYRSDTRPDLEIAHHAVAAAKASGVKRYIVSAVWCLGWTYRQLGDHRSSYDHLHEAYLLSDDPSLGAIHCQCGLILVEVANQFQDYDWVVSLARNLARKCAALSDNDIHGWSLVFLGSALNEAQQRQEALLHLKHAITILEAGKITSYQADAYQIIARVHYKESRLQDALDAIHAACRLVESSPDVRIYFDAGLIHFSADRDTEAWKYTEIALMKASHIGDRLNIARALQLMGYGYLRRGDYENAYGAYEAAVEKYHGTVNPGGRAKCENNLGRVKEKLMNPDAKVCFYRHSMDVDKSPFYPPRSSVSNDDKTFLHDAFDPISHFASSSTLVSFVKPSTTSLMTKILNRPISPRDKNHVRPLC